MTKSLHQIFKQIKEMNPPAGLEERILQKIALERKWQVKKKLIFTDILSLSSAGALVFTLINFGSELLKSDFWNLMKLVFSDTAVVAGNWKDFLFSLLETFPAVHAALILAPIFLLMVSLKIYFSNNNYNYYKHYNH